MNHERGGMEARVLPSGLTLRGILRESVNVHRAIRKPCRLNSTQGTFALECEKFLESWVEAKA